MNNKEYYEQLYAYKLDNLDEKGSMLWKPQSAKSHIWRNRQSEQNFIKETESIISNFPKQKAPCPEGFNDEFYQSFKEEIISILYILL